MRPQITIGVVLAGGQSKRMGQDKALLQVKGKAFLTHTIDVLKAVKPKLSRIVISGRQSKTSYIQDIYQNLGPVGGIYSVLQSYRHVNDSLLIMPVDMPFMTPRALNYLVARAKSSLAFNALIYKGKCFPLFIRLVSDVFRFFEKSIREARPENKSRSIQNLLAHLDTCEINWDVEDEKLFSNVNTPGDLALICQEEK